MSGRKIIIVAILVYGCVIACVMWPGNRVADANPAAPTGLTPLNGMKPFCGVAVQVERVDLIDEYKKTINDIADDGADSVSLVVEARQENGESDNMYIDERRAPTAAQLTDLIQYAKSRKLRVVLMPIVLLDAPIHDEWRGTIAPHDWHAWFENYRDMMNHYAVISESAGVDLLVVGSELVSSEDHEDEWIATIQSIRDRYHGRLTYSSNWDRYWKIKFWNYLDFIGMNSYWALGDNSNVTVDQVKANWEKIQSKIFTFAGSVHKPVILLEAGWCSLSNAATDAWDYTQEQLPADPGLQATLYEGFFQAWWGKPELAGFFMWNFVPGGDPTGKSYSPQGKPAENILRLWLRQPRWTVAPD